MSRSVDLRRACDDAVTAEAFKELDAGAAGERTNMRSAVFHGGFGERHGYGRSSIVAVNPIAAIRITAERQPSGGDSGRRFV